MGQKKKVSIKKGKNLIWNMVMISGYTIYFLHSTQFTNMMLKPTAMDAVINITLPSTSYSRFITLFAASYTNTPVTIQIAMTLMRAPMISANG